MQASTGERLAAWRKAAGLSQAAAAGKVGIAQPTWAKWEADITAPDRVRAPLVEQLTGGLVKASDWPDRKSKNNGNQHRKAS